MPNLAQNSSTFAPRSRHASAAILFSNRNSSFAATRPTRAQPELRNQPQTHVAMSAMLDFEARPAPPPEERRGQPQRRRRRQRVGVRADAAGENHEDSPKLAKRAKFWVVLEQAQSRPQQRDRGVCVEVGGTQLESGHVLRLVPDVTRCSCGAASIENH